MILGHVRDNMPRVMLTLPGLNGPLHVEFIVDTGFDGELALPYSLLNQLNASFTMDQAILLADGSQGRRPVYTMEFDWEGELRLTNVLGLEGNPLLGGELMAGYLLHAEMTDGGEVSLESL